VEGSGVSFELSVGHLVEVADGCEELDDGVCDPVAASSFAFVHVFEFFSVVFDGFQV